MDTEILTSAQDLDFSFLALFLRAGLTVQIVMVLLIVHSLAESRLLIEIGFALLVVFAIRTRSNRGQNQHVPGMATPA